MSGPQESCQSLYALSAKVRTGIKKRFLKKLRKTRSCWVWLGKDGGTGYGRFWIKGHFTKRASRISYELFVRRIPKGLTIDHLCRNRICVNPKHLEAVTSRENILRGIGPSARNSKVTHCPQGHPYKGRNVMINKKRQRICRICSYKLSREFKARKRKAHRIALDPEEVVGVSDG